MLTDRQIDIQIDRQIDKNRNIMLTDRQIDKWIKTLSGVFM